MFNTPILFLIFNRPETTQIVFNEIKSLKPKKLFIAADGHRENKEGERVKCEEARNIVLSQVNWDCEVKTLFRDNNVGCKKAVSSAITWFFENVEEGIILEDDCLPDQSFFWFCKELLEKYRNNKKVMHIGGTNYIKFGIKSKFSYYFSNYSTIWGWATWKRAWNLFDGNILTLHDFIKNNKFKNIRLHKKQKKIWLDCFIQVYKNRVDTWDYQWFYTILNNNGISIIPMRNLVSNIGFNETATHTTDNSANVANLEKKNIIFPLIHQKKLKINKLIENLMFHSFYSYRRKINFKDIFIFLFSKKIKSLLKFIVKSTFRDSIFESIKFKKLPEIYPINATLLDKKIEILEPKKFLLYKELIFTKESLKFRSQNKTPYIIDWDSDIGLSTIYFKILYPDAEIVSAESDNIKLNLIKENVKIFKLDKINIISNLKNNITDYLNREIDLLKIKIHDYQGFLLFLDCKDKLLNIKYIYIDYLSYVNKEQHFDEVLSILKDNSFRYYINNFYSENSSPFIETASLIEEFHVQIFCFK